MSVRYIRYCIAILVGLSDCSQAPEPGRYELTELLYSNDFESPADSAGWQYEGEVALYYDSTRDSGNGCLSVAGSDVAPHAEKVLDTLRQRGEIIFRFDARCLEHPGGSVTLRFLGPFVPYPAAGFGITDTTWNSFADTTYFPGGYPLRIWINGDIVSGSPVLVDNVEVLLLNYPAPD